MEDTLALVNELLSQASLQLAKDPTSSMVVALDAKTPPANSSITPSTKTGGTTPLSEPPLQQLPRVPSISQSPSRHVPHPPTAARDHVQAEASPSPKQASTTFPAPPKSAEDSPQQSKVELPSNSQLLQRSTSNASHGSASTAGSRRKQQKQAQIAAAAAANAAQMEELQKLLAAQRALMEATAAPVAKPKKEKKEKKEKLDKKKLEVEKYEQPPSVEATAPDGPLGTPEQQQQAAVTALRTISLDSGIVSSQSLAEATSGVVAPIEPQATGHGIQVVSVLSDNTPELSRTPATQQLEEQPAEHPFIVAATKPSADDKPVSFDSTSVPTPPSASDRLSVPPFDTVSLLNSVNPATDSSMQRPPSPMLTSFASNSVNKLVPLVHIGGGSDHSFVSGLPSPSAGMAGATTAADSPPARPREHSKADSAIMPVSNSPPQEDHQPTLHLAEHKHTSPVLMENTVPISLVEPPAGVGAMASRRSLTIIVDSTEEQPPPPPPPPPKEEHSPMTVTNDKPFSSASPPPSGSQELMNSEALMEAPIVIGRPSSAVRATGSTVSVSPSEGTISASAPVSPGSSMASTSTTTTSSGSKSKSKSLHPPPMPKAGAIASGRKSTQTTTSTTSGGSSTTTTSIAVPTTAVVSSMIIVPIVSEHLRQDLDLMSLCTRFTQWLLAVRPELLETVFYGRPIAGVISALAEVLKQAPAMLDAMSRDISGGSGKEGSEDSKASLSDPKHLPAPQVKSPGDQRGDRRAVKPGASLSGGPLAYMRRGTEDSIPPLIANPSAALDALIEGFYVQSFGNTMPAIATEEECVLHLEGFIKEVERQLAKSLSEEELRQWYSFCELLFRPNRNGPLSASVLGPEVVAPPQSLQPVKGLPPSALGAHRPRASPLNPSTSQSPPSTTEYQFNDNASNSGGSTSSGPKKRIYDMRLLAQCRTPVFLTLAKEWLPQHAAHLEEAYQHVDSCSNSTDIKSSADSQNTGKPTSSASATPSAAPNAFAPVLKPTSDVDLIKYSWTLIIKTTRSEFGKGVLREMFAIMPSLNRSGPFRNANTQQLGAQLELLFGTVVNALGDIQPVIPSLLQLGARHAGYGLTAEYSEVFVMALDVTVANLLKDTTYTPQMKGAWEALTRFLLEVMTAGAQQMPVDKKKRRPHRAGGGDLNGTASMADSGGSSSRSRKSNSSFHSAVESSKGTSLMNSPGIINPNSTTNINSSSESMLSYERSVNSHASANVVDDSTTTLAQFFREVLKSDVTGLLKAFEELLAMCLSDLSASARFAEHIIVHELKLVPATETPISHPGYTTSDSPYPSGTTATTTPPSMVHSTIPSAATTSIPISSSGGFDSAALIGMLLRYISLLHSMVANRAIITIAVVKRALLFFRFFGFDSFEPVRSLLEYIGGGRLKYELCMQRVLLPLSALFESARSSDDFTQPARVLRECWNMVNNRELMPQLLFMISGQLAALPNMAVWRTPSHFMRKVHIIGVQEIINVVCGVHGEGGNPLPQAEGPTSSSGSGPSTQSNSIAAGAGYNAPHLLSADGPISPPGDSEARLLQQKKVPHTALVIGADVQRACAKLGLWLRVLGLAPEAHHVVEIIVSSIWDVLQTFDSARRHSLLWSFTQSLSSMVECGALPYACTMADRRKCDIHWRIVQSTLMTKEIGVTSVGSGFGEQGGGVGGWGAAGSQVTLIDELIRLLPQLKQGVFKRVSYNTVNEVHKRFMAKVVDTALYGTIKAINQAPLGDLGAPQNARRKSFASTVSATTYGEPTPPDDGPADTATTGSDNATIVSDSSSHRAHTVVTLSIPNLPALLPSQLSNNNSYSKQAAPEVANHSLAPSLSSAVHNSALPLRLAAADEEELRQLGLHHTIWGVLEEHYAVFISAFVSYLRLLHIQSPSMPPVATVPATAWLSVLFYLSSRMSSTAASARDMLQRHATKDDVSKIIKIQSLQRARMSRHEVNKRRVFQDKVVRNILGVGIVPEEGNRYRQQVLKRSLEIQTVSAAHNNAVERRGTTTFGGGAPPDAEGINRRTTITTTSAHHRSMALGYKDRLRGKDNTAFNSYGMRLPSSPTKDMSPLANTLPPQSPTPSTNTANSGYFVLTTFGANNMQVNTVHLNEDMEADDTVGGSGSGGSGSGGNRLRGALRYPAHRLSDVDDGQDWEVLDGKITPGLNRLLALLWASMGTQGRSIAVQGALREYSERFQTRLFGSASAGRAELKQTGELLLQMMVFYGGLESGKAKELSPTTSSSSNKAQRRGSGGTDGTSSSLTARISSQSPLAPNSSVLPFTLKRTFLHDPNLHNLPTHYHMHHHPSPMLPYAHGMASPPSYQGSIPTALMPSPPLHSRTHQSARHVRSKINKGSKHGSNTHTHRHTGPSTGLHVPLLPNGEPVLTEVGVEELIILLEDTDFGQIHIDRMLGACPEEHKSHPAVRLAWLELYACLLFNVKLLLDPTNPTPKRSSSRSASQSGGGQPTTQVAVGGIRVR